MSPSLLTLTTPWARSRVHPLTIFGPFLPSRWGSGYFSSTPSPTPPPTSSTSPLKVHFITQDQEHRVIEVNEEGASLLDIAHAHHLDLEGACEGSLACSTCHVVVDPKDYVKLSEPSDEENDMLDLAFGLTET
ncbi:hypothetical protein HMI55_004129 [Coelomomyces lativittatus]|nr:hypothetical protein HMI55_004129 [Coelomomyces lativittatus]